jgi:hypothetical protein
VPEQVFVAQPIGIGKAQIIATPFQFEFTGEDRLVMAVYASVTTTVVATLRFVNKDGTIDVSQHAVSVTGNRLQHPSRIPMGHGFLSNLVVRPISAGVQVGECYVVVFVIRGGGTGPTTTIGQVLGGYTTLNAPLAWPGSPIVAGSEGHGLFRVIDLGTPPAGTELQATVPITTRWAPLMFRGFLTAVVIGTDRSISLQYNAAGSGVQIGGFAQPNPHQDGSSGGYTWARGLEMHEDVAGTGEMQAAIPMETTLPTGTLIRTSVGGLQPGDQWNFGFLTVQEWLSP